MENIIKKANELYEVLIVKSRSVGEQEVKNRDKEAGLIALSAELMAKESALNKREDEIKKVEDIVALANSCKREKSANEKEAARLRGEKQKLEEQERASKLEVAKERNVISHDRELLKKGWDGLRAAEKTFEERSKTIKQDILDQISKGIKV